MEEQAKYSAMTLDKAITQLKKIRNNLKRANLQYVSQETIVFRLESIKAIDVILRELEKER
jgi:hypothetical protein